MTDDLISRQAAIDAIKEYLEEYDGIDHDGYHDPKWCAMSEAKLTLESLPSEPRWIPVTERLPEIDMSYPHHEDYLVQYDSGNMDVASWSNVNRFWADRVTEPHWNCGFPFAEVTAWMPLPNPWKGEDNAEIH